jgi:Fe-S cluster assembly protein SufD
VLEEGSDVQIIERHQSLGSKPVFTNSVSEIFVHANASLELYRVQNDANTASIVDHTSIQQHRDSRVRTAVFSLGGKLMRNDLNIAFLGENAEAHLDGLTLLDDGQHADHHTRVDHRVPHCNSFEMYKGIYDGNSKGVFNGQIMVRPHAQKTNAFQQNNNIILGEKASVDTKPQLEIFADDVKCSHGCTVGQLDDEALFYLRSRGIPEHEAKALLLYAIGDEVIGKVRLKELRNRLHKLMAKKLNVDFQMEI